MLDPALRRIAAALVWLQVPALGYLLAGDELRCIQVSCWADGVYGVSTAVSYLAIFGVPVALGVFLWRGEMAAAVVALLLAVPEILFSCFAAFVFLYDLAGSGYPLWDVASSAVIIPGELAIATVLLIAGALVTGRTRPGHERIRRLPIDRPG